MHKTVEALEFMTPQEVRRSVARGNAIAKQLRDNQDEHRFRYPHAIFLIAMRQGFRSAAETALELANGKFTMNEAMRHVRQVFQTGKQEMKDRNP